MIRSLELNEDGEHLEVAAGTGEPGLSIEVNGKPSISSHARCITGTK